MPPSDDLPARLEERLEALARLHEDRLDGLVKQVGRVEEGMLRQLLDVERNVKATINGRIGAIETKVSKLEQEQPLNNLARVLVFGFCAMALTALAAGLIGYVIGLPHRGVPTLPQPYTVPPHYERSR